MLEVSASWVSAGPVERVRCWGDLIRRRWSAAVPNSAVRRVVFTVVDPGPVVHLVSGATATAAKWRSTRST